jgi:hypothetical protein
MHAQILPSKCGVCTQTHCLTFHTDATLQALNANIVKLTYKLETIADPNPNVAGIDC